MRECLPGRHMIQCHVWFVTTTDFTTEAVRVRGRDFIGRQPEFLIAGDSEKRQLFLHTYEQKTHETPRLQKKPRLQPFFEPELSVSKKGCTRSRLAARARQPFRARARQPFGHTSYAQKGCKRGSLVHTYIHMHIITHTHTICINMYIIEHGTICEAKPILACVGEHNDIHDVILVMHTDLSLLQCTVCLAKKTRRWSLATAATRITSVPHAIRSSRPGLWKNCV